MSSYPDWLRILSWACLSVSFVCAAIIIGDELRRPQKMMIMNFVWPITALYLGPAGLWGYLRSGLKMTQLPHRQLQREVRAEPNALTREQVALATTHCGAGCALGDIFSEWLVFAMALTFAGGEFPVMLYSTLGAENSMTAYSAAATENSLRLALIWWPLGLALAVVYFVFISRRYAGKVTARRDTQGYY